MDGIDPRPAAPTSSLPGRAVTMLMAVPLSGAAAIHLAMVPAHATSSMLEAVGFAVAGWAQAGLAAVLLLRPSRRAVAATVGVCLTVLAAWMYSRTLGLPIGAHPGVPEPVGILDGLCAGFEVLVVTGGLVSRWTPPRWASTSSMPTAVAAAVLVAAATTAVLVSPAGQHGHTDTNHDHEASSSTHDHPACTDEVTAQQQAAADALVAHTRAAMAGYVDFGKAQADGFVPITPPGGKLVHYAVPQRLSDGKVLQPDAVESLVYAQGPSDAKYFLGAMYLQDGQNPSTPTPGGCATTWHAHDNLCLSPQQGMTGVVGADGTCPAGSTNKTTAMMLHVWSIDLPAGPFAELHDIKTSDIIAGLKASGVTLK